MLKIMEQNLLQLGAVAVIFLFSIKEFFAWLRSRNNGSGNAQQRSLDAMNARLKEMGNDNHHEVMGKLDDLIKVNDEQLYILKDIKDALKNTNK